MRTPSQVSDRISMQINTAGFLPFSGRTWGITMYEDVWRPLTITRRASREPVTCHCCISIQQSNIDTRRSGKSTGSTKPKVREFDSRMSLRISLQRSRLLTIRKMEPIRRDTRVLHRIDSCSKRCQAMRSAQIWPPTTAFAQVSRPHRKAGRELLICLDKPSVAECRCRRVLLK